MKEAETIWRRSIEYAKFTNDWSTAGKAAINLGILLRVSDCPQAGIEILNNAKYFFQLANNPEKITKVNKFLGMPREKILPYAIGLGYS